MVGPELLLTCLLSFAAGVIATMVYQKQLSSDSRHNRDVERHLQETQDQLKSYQQEVSDHFERTAELVDQLTESYRDVHNHLAEGATKLLDLPPSENIIQSMPSRDKLESPRETPADISPPKDWAPKRTPYDKGVLDESFGIDKSAKKPEENAAPPIM